MANGNSGKMIVYNSGRDHSAMDAMMGISKNNRLNVKDGSKKDINGVANKKNISPEEKRRRTAWWTMHCVEEQLKDLGDKFSKHDYEFRVRTESSDPYGGAITLRVFQDPSDGPKIISIYDDDEVLNDYINDNSSIRNLIDEINYMVKVANNNNSFNIELVYDKLGRGHCLVAKGPVEQYAYMKWAILDILRKIYDEDDEVFDWLNIQ